jgi:hypothetical protein
MPAFYVGRGNERIGRNSSLVVVFTMWLIVKLVTFGTHHGVQLSFMFASCRSYFSLMVQVSFSAVSDFWSLVTLQDWNCGSILKEIIFHMCYHSGMVMVLFAEDGIFVHVWHLGSFKCSIFPIQWGVLLALFLFLMNFRIPWNKYDSVIIFIRWFYNNLCILWFKRSKYSFIMFVFSSKIDNCQIRLKKLLEQ